MDDRSIKVLIVEDSRSTAMALSSLLGSFNVVGVARDGQQALRMQARLRPHIITMDIHLPDIDGLDLTRKILSRRTQPVIVVSSLLSTKRQGLVFEALRAGAYDVVSKSSFFSTDGTARPAHKLVRLVRSAATRHLRHKPKALAYVSTPEAVNRQRDEQIRKRSVLAIGASTGGPAALRAVLEVLGADFPLPVLVAQHMAEGFTEGFTRWLNSYTALTVCTATHGQRPRPSVVYLPPSAHHLSVSDDGALALTPGEDDGYCPSVNRLFSTVARSFGSQAICVLLTGMGSDGAEGMLTAKRNQALTAVQDEASSVIFGMPQAALRLGAADHMLSLGEIAPWLVRHVIVRT